MRLQILAIITFAFALICVESCSMIGLGVGAAVEKSKPPVSIEGWQAEKIKYGSSLVLTIDDGRIIQGKYVKHPKSLNKSDAKNTISFRSRFTGKATITKQIPIERIQYVTIRYKRTAPLIGFAIGAAVDVGVLLATNGFRDLGRDDPSPEVELGMGSCPLVYVYQDNQYKLDAEPFGGALFKSAEYTDFDRLEHITVLNNKYQLRITNQPEETQFINQLQLHLIEHPQNTQVLPSNTGELLAIGAVIPPISATSYENYNVVDLLKEKDEKVWLANPFNRDPEIKFHLRAGIVMEFEKPKNAPQAKLILNLQNTSWGASLQKEMLGLHGTELENWYKALNESKKLRQELARLMVREGMLQVKIWDGSTWQNQGYVWEVGPAVDKDLAIKLDIQSVEGEILKIQMECPPGIWIINSAGIDYSYSNKYTQTIIKPNQGLNQEGKDILSLIEHSDEEYLTMMDPEDFIDLSYSVPPTKDGYERTVILQSRGYYKIHVDDSGEPQTELIERMKKEPYLYIKTALQSLNQQFSQIDW